MNNSSRWKAFLEWWSYAKKGNYLDLHDLAQEIDKKIEEIKRGYDDAK